MSLAKMVLSHIGETEEIVVQFWWRNNSWDYYFSLLLFIYVKRNIRWWK